KDWPETARRLSADFATRAAAHDADDSFVAENYAALREAKLFSAAVPAELGGGGAAFAEHAEMIRILGRGCGSTALAYSMH
ncbi:MAG: acyl-CoA dehydrogenase family protein, partial [Chloroflexota bacterium]